jgi:hypothetical protein
MMKELRRGVLERCVLLLAILPFAASWPHSASASPITRVVASKQDKACETAVVESLVEVLNKSIRDKVTIDTAGPTVHGASAQWEKLAPLMNLAFQSRRGQCPASFPNSLQSPHLRSLLQAPPKEPSDWDPGPLALQVFLKSDSVRLVELPDDPGAAMLDLSPDIKSQIAALRPATTPIVAPPPPSALRFEAASGGSLCDQAFLSLLASYLSSRSAKGMRLRAVGMQQVQVTAANPPFSSLVDEVQDKLSLDSSCQADFETRHHGPWINALRYQYSPSGTIESFLNSGEVKLTFPDNPGTVIVGFGESDRPLGWWSRVWKGLSELPFWLIFLIVSLATLICGVGVFAIIDWLRDRAHDANFVEGDTGRRNVAPPAAPLTEERVRNLIGEFMRPLQNDIAALRRQAQNASNETRPSDISLWFEKEFEALKATVERLQSQVSEGRDRPTAPRPLENRQIEVPQQPRPIPGLDEWERQRIADYRNAVSPSGGERVLESWQPLTQLGMPHDATWKGISPEKFIVARCPDGQSYLLAPSVHTFRGIRNNRNAVFDALSEELFTGEPGNFDQVEIVSFPKIRVSQGRGELVAKGAVRFRSY